MRRYLTRSGGPCKREQGESSEPIDLTEQSQFPSPAPSPAPPGASGAPSPLSEPQIPSEIAPEVLIRRPMLTQPPIEGNLAAELGHFTLSCALTQPPSNCAGACTFIPSTAQIPHGASADPERFLLP
ncbi:hypothetical protein CK203_112116 [Vitis vinifera]|uniref:Uncharacterized protein n=1 Tax=Vitis vinifera TaxID=29760 RepID=A0A438FE94_VITVI|nr:hypothetical protein CK203_112116 [Vitis vinifera]